jgi:ADP-heptose:LPS heptosyltransferase
LGSTSASSPSQELLRYCLAGENWPDSLLCESMTEDGGRALLRIVVERLADLFEPALCDVYATLFTRVIEIVSPEFGAPDLLRRYERVRRPRACHHDPETVYVLSRVTLGADVAVTSIVLDAMKQRFPGAAIVLVGPRKNHELFAADRRIALHEFEYPRGAGIAARIRSVPDLRTPHSIVVDPDSRLTQLGLLPVCLEADYFFFESRSYGGDGAEPLVTLTKRWVSETFSVRDAKAYIAPLAQSVDADIAVSLGVGENQDKRLPDPFEKKLLAVLVETGKQIVLDEGGADEERERVRGLVSRVPGVRTWSGSYAPFAHTISRAKLYVGYDSAGQHVAAACGVPLLSIFAGYVSDRMFSRWQPTGPGPITVIKVSARDPDRVLEGVNDALQNLTL